MGGHLAIQGDLAQLDLAVFPACGSRDLSGSTGPLPGLHPRLSAWDTLAAPPLDHCSTSRHQDRSRGAMNHFSILPDARVSCHQAQSIGSISEKMDIVPVM